MTKADVLYAAGPQLILGGIVIVTSSVFLLVVMAVVWFTIPYYGSYTAAVAVQWDSGATQIVIVMALAGIPLVRAGRGA